MAGTIASYPAVAGGSGNGVAIYATFAAFPAANSVPAGTLAVAADTGILYESDGVTWNPIASPGAALSVGTFDSGTPSANGAHIDSNALIMQSASGTNPGLVNVSTQTLAGVKTFSSAPNLSSLTASLPLKLDVSKNVTAAAINVSGAEITGTLPIGNGGTGQTTANPAFNALSPLTTKGDMVAYSTVNDRLPVGTNGQVITADSAQALGVKWATPTTGTVTSVDVSGGTTGITTSGGPVTSSGTITLGGTLGIANGGTGQTTANPAFNALSPLTTKGDTLAYSTVNARVPVGTNGQVLTADSAQTLGLKWATPTTGTVTSVDVSGGTTGLTTSGGPVTSSGTITIAGTLGVANGGTGSTSLTANNVLLGNGTSALQVVAPGTSGNVLTSNGTTWSSAVLPAGGFATSYKSANFSAASGFNYLCNTTSVGFTATLPAGSAGAVIQFEDDAQTWATNGLIIAPATGEKIQGLANNDTLTLNISGSFANFAWDSTNSYWVVVGSGFTYTPLATTTVPGLVSTTAQSLAGIKTFADGINLNNSNLSFYQTTSKTVNAGGIVATAAVTVQETRIGDLIIINVNALGKQTKDGSNGAITVALDSNFGNSDTFLTQQQIVNNVYQAGLWRINGATLSMFNGMNGSNISASTPNVGWDVPLSFAFTRT